MSTDRLPRTRLQQHLAQACRELDLRLALDSEILLPSGRLIVALAHLPSLGYQKGMVVVTSSDEIRGAAEELVAEGYGYSVLTEPPPSEAYDQVNFVELFRDWGWNSGEQRPPDWLN